MSRALRIGPVLAVLAVAGYLLGGCGGGDGGGGALSGLSDLTGSRPDVTLPTLPPLSTEVDTTTEPTTEAEETTTEPATTTGATDSGAEEPPSEGGRLGAWIALALAAARGEDETTTVEVTRTEEAPATEEAPTTTEPVLTLDPEPTSSESDTPWGWIVGLGLALAAVVAGVVVWRRRRTGTG